MTLSPPGDSLGSLDLSVEPSLDRDRGAGVAEQSPRSWRTALGWSATSAPVAFLLVTGIVLGPHGINLLSPTTLILLDPTIPVSLAALGALAGLAVGDRRMDGWRMAGAAGIDAIVTMIVVSTGIAAIALAALPSIVPSVWPLAVACGICAASSLTLPLGSHLEPRTMATRVSELSVLVPIVLGGFALAGDRTDTAGEAGLLIAQACFVTLALAAASWLLLTRASSETEERVFVLSALLLVGGAADALSLSALLGGLVAGVFWRSAGLQVRETITRHVLFVQHPLIVLVLLVAGARANLTAEAAGLGMGYALLRAAGKSAAGPWAGRANQAPVPRDLAFDLLPPGVFGVAFALNAFNIAGAGAPLLLATVVIGTIVSDVVALLSPARDDSQ